MQLKLIFTLYKAAQLRLISEWRRQKFSILGRVVFRVSFSFLGWNGMSKEDSFLWAETPLHSASSQLSSTAVCRMCCICLHRICHEISLTLDELIVLSYDSDEAHSRHTRCRLVGRRKTHTFFSSLISFMKVGCAISQWTTVCSVLAEL